MGLWGVSGWFAGHLSLLLPASVYLRFSDILYFSVDEQYYACLLQPFSLKLVQSWILSGNAKRLACYGWALCHGPAKALLCWVNVTSNGGMMQNLRLRVGLFGRRLLEEDYKGLVLFLFLFALHFIFTFSPSILSSFSRPLAGVIFSSPFPTGIFIC